MIKQLKQPFNLITLALAVISIILSVLFYQNSKKTRKVAFQITQPIIKIFDSENATSKIKLLENDSILITKNVYLLTGKIWNNGNLPILPSDVRKKLTLKLDSSNRILDYKIIDEKEKGISDFKLSLLSKNELNLDWEYFDPNNGLVFQVIFIGENDEPNFKLNGKVLGVSNFDEVEFFKDKRTTSLLVLILSYPVIAIFAFVRAIMRKRKNDSYWHWMVISFGTLLIAMFLFMKYYVFIDKIPL